MKRISVCLLLTLMTTTSLATGNDLIIEKINEKINQLEEQRIAQPTDRLITVPWDIVDKREQQLWSSIIQSYDFLKSYYITERYNYIYKGVKAMTLGHPQRVEALKEWIKTEDQYYVSKKLNPKFYQQWNKHIAEISSAVDEIAKSRPEVRFITSDKDLQNEQYQFLKQIQEELTALDEEIVIQTSDEVMPSPAFFSEVNRNKIFFSGLAGLLGLGFLLISRKKREPVEVKTELPPLPIEEMDELDEMEVTHESAPIITISPGISMEEECHKVMEEIGHLLKIADITTYPMNRSPFKTDVHAPKEKVTEAINWLLKGTIAIANTSGAKVSHLEWNCRENEGRVSLDLVLHGLECDYKALYLNTLVEGDSSAPAHFGRTEMALDGHSPTVMFKKGNNRTTISLGVDSHGHSLSH